MISDIFFFLPFFQYTFLCYFVVIFFVSCQSEENERKNALSKFQRIDQLGIAYCVAIVIWMDGNKIWAMLLKRNWFLSVWIWHRVPALCNIATAEKVLIYLPLWIRLPLPLPLLLALRFVFSGPVHIDYYYLYSTFNSKRKPLPSPSYFLFSILNACLYFNIL